MTLTITNETNPVYQATQHAMLVAWGRFARHLNLSERLRQAVRIPRQANAIPGGDLILQFGLASLAGYEYLQDLNLGPHPLGGNQAVADAWDMAFGHDTTVSRFLYQVDEATVAAVQAELEAVSQPFVRRAVHEALSQQGELTLCGDLTGRPVSVYRMAYSMTYPPDTTFGYMADQLQKRHKAALVTLMGKEHRLHVTASHLPGNTVSGPCLEEMVSASEERLSCRPRRRTERLRQRIAAIEEKRAQKQRWCQRQQDIIRRQIARHVRLSGQLQTLKPKLAELEAHYAGKVVKPHSYLIEMGYDLFTIAHNGKVTGALLKEAPPDAPWQPVGPRTQALDMPQQRVGDCPYPLRLTLLRWQVGEGYRYSTLVSFTESDALPTAALFPTYHQRQDVEAGIKLCFKWQHKPRVE